LQKNGVVEQKNKSIVETAKSMVHDLDFPMFLWVEACYIAIYILNRCPYKVLMEKTPKEAFIREKPYVFHFRCV
jgi:hypothetical protein